MNWRWLIFDYIPAELELRRLQRWVIRGEARRLMLKAHRRRSIIWGVIALPLGWAAIIGLMGAIRFLTVRGMPAFLGPLAWLTLFLVVHIAGATFWRSLNQRYTYQVLRQRGHNVCSECGYLLKGLPDNQEHCPDCGKACRKMNVLGDPKGPSLWKGPDQ